jgi:DNA-binding NarL/FixJ family response regulator
MSLMNGSNFSVRDAQDCTGMNVGPEPAIPVAIVDHDENDRRLIRRIVDRTGQFRCVGSYFSGRDALAGIPSSNPAVVLMNIHMPGMSGLDCTRQMARLDPRANGALILPRDEYAL